MILADGVYSNNRDTRSMASGEVRARNTLMRRDFPTFPAINKIYLGPGMGFNLGEFELCVVGVHLLDLFSRRCSKNLDNLHKLVHSTVSGEDGLAKHQFCKYRSFSKGFYQYHFYKMKFDSPNSPANTHPADHTSMLVV